MERIMTRSPIQATMRKNVASHPSAIAPAPTCPVATPYVKNLTMVVAEELDRCCQKPVKRVRTQETTRQPNAALETTREGNGFTSLSDPLLVLSSCHPGKVASRRIAAMAATIEINLRELV